MNLTKALKISSESAVVENQRTVLVPSEPHLCRRVAMRVVGMAQRFQSDILLTAGSLHIDGKSSLMAIMVLGALKGQTLLLSASGQDAKQALDALAALFNVS